MKIDLIVIGNELLNGKTRDINGSQIGSYLKDRGSSLNSITVIPDDEEVIISSVRSKCSKDTLIITTGGIGPTKDDKTKSSMARCFNKKLIRSDQAIEVILENYKRKGFKWRPESNHYHMMPEGFIALNNQNGYAPGLKYEENGCTVISMPGVPQEVKGMLSHLSPYISSDANKIEMCIQTKEVAEEVIFNSLCPDLWSDLSKFGEVSSLPSGGMVKICIKTTNEHTKEIESFIKTTKLAPYIWQIGTKSLYEHTLQLLIDNKATIAFAESCTGGLAASLMTDISGSSEALLGSVVSYSNSAKMNILGVKEETINKFDVVSKEVATEMAIGARTKLNSDIAISFTGFAGPGATTEDSSVGVAWIGFSTTKQSGARKVEFSGDRLFLKQKFVNYGYYKIIDLLEDQLF